jgi:hypothetical protein
MHILPLFAHILYLETGIFNHRAVIKFVGWKVYKLNNTFLSRPYVFFTS